MKTDVIKEICKVFFIKNIHRFLGENYGIDFIHNINLDFNADEIEVKHCDSVLYYSYEKNVLPELLKWLKI